ncbi:MAG: LysM peptidoglycan-binding domain-containing protein [Anaerolineaceae bacterium]|nr:LysM peptidoglycan-binding domain-containing protein [Anaerolineaceae bacterium]
MKKPLVMLLIILVLVASTVYFASVPAQASNRFPQAVYQTPTPDETGRIMYTVKEGETCLSISLLTKTSLENIRALNNLDINCSIFSGQQLLLMVVIETPIVATIDITDTPSGPTPTPFRGNGQICIVLFDDVDGNGRKSDTETLIADGSISISDRVGSVSLTGKSAAGEDPVCFIDIPEGDYNISIAVPEAYNPTTALNYPLSLKAGDMATIDFGAQSKESSEKIRGGSSSWLGIVGIILVLIGIGMGVYLWRSNRIR